MAAILLYSLTLALSAALLFLVQPMIGKAVLPALGGTPATWAVCMLFFQALLLLAYAYAHFLASYLNQRVQLVLHAGLIAAAAAFPLSIGEFGAASTGEAPQLFLLKWLLASSGTAYFAVCATAPLLQAWFARVRHTGAKDPYFLYAASNAGSLLGLVAYPFLVEPALELARQEALWRAAFIGCGGLIIVCGAIFPMDQNRAPPAAPHSAPRAAASWIALAFVPSSLLLAVTMHITTNISPVPLFWVIPLALYLLSFILAFSSYQEFMHAALRRYLPLITLPYAPLIFVSGTSEILLIALQMTLFFAVCLYCHVELAVRRPPAARLTEFYLYMSLGGMLGGVFNALLAPMIFNSAPEYPLMLCCAVLLWGLFTRSGRPSLADAVKFGSAILIAGAASAYGSSLGLPFSLELFFIYGVPALICFSLISKPVLFAALFSALVATLAVSLGNRSSELLFQDRNFFGVKEVRFDRSANANELVHGVIVHGIQSRAPELNSVPLAYFHPEGPVGDIFESLTHSALRAKVGIIGLGIGAMASYSRAGDSFDFYEIDPLVVALAQDGKYFTYLADAKGTCTVIEGDGRLRIAEAPDNHYGIIFMDAFTSDAVPVHLLTKEAIDLYTRKLRAGGVLVFNVSNNFLSFPDLLAPLAAHAGMTALIRDDVDISPEQMKAGRFASRYVIFTTNMNLGTKLLETGKWRWLKAGREVPMWRDHYSNIVSLMR